MNDNFIPFNRIGLCFSGGGYRATFFSLGVVSYLNNIKYKDKVLLEHVQAISSVSGGTLLGVAYSKAAQEDNFDFVTFYQNFYNRFKPENDKLLDTAIAKLEDNQVWKEHPYKTRSLINAFALTYAEMDIYKGGFDVFEHVKSNHLKQVCFNSTEFSFGLAFRFQNTGLFGNKPLNCKEMKPLMYQTQLGDIVASSSCFPMGFEPLVYPDDYYKDQKSTAYRNLKSLDNFIEGVGIMDGGIADNQGIGSMMNISKWEDNKNELDLIIVNDVSSYKMTPWQNDPLDVRDKMSLKRKITMSLKYLSVKPLYVLILVIGILTMLLNSIEIFGKPFTSLYIIGSILAGIGLTLTFLGGMLSVAKAFGLMWVKSLLKKNIPEVLMDEVVGFERLDIGLLENMVTNRLTSTVKMVNDVFLNQLRRLNYKLLYSKETLKHKVMTSTVYELNGVASVYTNKFNYNKKISPAPSKLLTSIGLIASEMPTTLWWDKTDIDKNRMDALIACGQFTTCYKLMDYILTLKDKAEELKLDSQEIKALDDLYLLLEKDWKAFNKSPMFLVEELNK